MELDGADLSGRVLHGMVLSGTKLLGVLMNGATIDGVITGLTVNGVEVAPLVDAELDRLHPERARLRATDPAGMRAAWAGLAAMWAATLERAAALPAAVADERVGGEWSLTETLRHLVFVTDAWFSHAALGQARPYHPLGLLPDFLPDTGAFGLDGAARPDLAEVLAVRQGRWAAVDGFLAAATREDLDRTRPANPSPAYPPPQPRTANACLHVVFAEEWAHHQYAIRDLAALEAAG
jgi:DinB superfamily